MHSSNTESVCGGHHDHTPNGTKILVAHSYEDWSAVIYWQMFYYLLGQAVLSVVVAVLTIVGKPLSMDGWKHGFSCSFIRQNIHVPYIVYKHGVSCSFIRQNIHVPYIVYKVILTALMSIIVDIAQF